MNDVTLVTRDDAVATAILGYLEEHPHGVDTLEGIAEWWVSRQQIRVHVTTVAPVLERLTKGGAVEVVAANGTRLYRRKVSTGEGSVDYVRGERPPVRTTPGAGAG